MRGLKKPDTLQKYVNKASVPALILAATDILVGWALHTYVGPVGTRWSRPASWFLLLLVFAPFVRAPTGASLKTSIQTKGNQSMSGYYLTLEGVGFRSHYLNS